MAKSNALVSVYLFAYNAFNAVGWAHIFYLTVTTVWTAYSSGAVWADIGRLTWDAVEYPVKYVQTLATMEILHAATGIVRSPVGSTITQSAARMFVLWAVAATCPPSRYQVGFPMMVFSWSFVEVPRYTFYALNVVGKVPSFIFFLRYHMFMVLYPSGFSGEVLTMISALPYLKETGKLAIQMPNTHNISVSLYSAIHVVVLLYTIGLFVMYGHMLTMRTRAYAKLKTTKTE